MTCPPTFILYVSDVAISVFEICRVFWLFLLSSLATKINLRLKVVGGRFLKLVSLILLLSLPASLCTPCCVSCWVWGITLALCPPQLVIPPSQPPSFSHMRSVLWEPIEEYLSQTIPPIPTHYNIFLTWNNKNAQLVDTLSLCLSRKTPRVAVKPERLIWLTPSGR